MQERIRVTTIDGIADVRLNRPDKMNALDQAMFDALIDTGRGLIAQRGLRAVVLSGEGRAFCAGLDMGRLEKMAAPPEAGAASVANELRLKPRSHGIANAPQYAALVWQDIPVPVIAALHGAALGGGLQIALGADMRFVAPDTRMSVLELTFSGRIFSGTEALALGFATRVCADPHQEAMAYAREVAGRNPDAIRAAKRLLKLAQGADAASVLQAESDEQIAVLGSPNQVEAVTANLQKRAPTFVDPA
jgi:enoyl-CoA hydratase/carnithine racemase